MAVLSARLLHSGGLSVARVPAAVGAMLRGRHAAAQHRAARVFARALSVSTDEDTQGHQDVVDSWRVNISGDPNKFVGPRPESWWTGKPPVHGTCPGVNSDGIIRSLPQPDLSNVTRQQLRDYFDNCWTMTEVLFSALQTEEPFYRPPYHNLRHPKIFYYAHPASVYVNKCRVAGLISKPINEYYEHIFETGVDEMQWDDLSKNDMRWPTVDEVKAYRQEVYNTVVDIIENHPAFETIDQLEASPFWAVVMGTEHEKIHLETSSVLMRELPLELVRPPEHFPAIHPSAREHGVTPDQEPVAGKDYPVNQFIEVEAGSVKLGKPRDFPSYGWDNEYGEKHMNVKSFKATKYLISNGEFLQFVKSGGYLDENVWEPEGWKWRCFRNVKWPTFWVPTGPSGLHQYRLRTAFEVVDMPWSWPANVNYHEAKAFANWKSDMEGRDRTQGYRIMTEAEHHRIRDDYMSDESLGVARDPGMVADGHEMADKYGFNLNLAHGSESPVDALKPTSLGFHDVFGSVWNWCEDHISALPNFKIHPYYNDFTLPCFDGQHNLILGGSFISCGDEASSFARFHFRPHFFQHAGFRLVLPNQTDPALVTSCMDNQGPYVGTNPFRSSRRDETERKYQAEEVLRQYVHLHYADDANVPEAARGYTDKVTQLLVDAAREHGVATDRVLDIGCGVGGTTFALARAFESVLGVDISASFIDAAQQLKEEGSLPYFIREEGDIKEEAVVGLPQGVDPARVEFKQMDAMCIPPDTGSFSAVLAANVLDRLSSPGTLLSRLGGARGLVRPGGILVLSSPYTWMEQYTPKDLWIGGHETPEGNVRSLDGLKAALGENFELLRTTQVPLAIREHARKFEYVISEATVWRHRS
ncbi:generic methyltransferase [Salpingoeca rosetta]|uniref:Generic methyltransferase n=1 Tax=Salpingoeca rosetta (strain ATCC 50818 / BSB-021) TaxID=946362 RepID=F2USG2_SALR5|nr:generic methyltransferase [Salpingoeca rosetta]EGD81071.1 generic methyltransferase [Salpingoeca rosetta]|eukprot:XP_004987940.1 generic methyltransferase [Salpingoeca rosetta]